MKEHLSIILFILLAVSCTIDRESDNVSQNRIVKNKTSIEKQIDTLNINGWSQRSLDAEASKSFALQALSKSNGINYFEGIGDAHKTLGALKVYIEEKEAGMAHYQKSLKAYIASENKIKEAALYLSIGNVLKDLGKLDVAVENYYEGLKISESINHKLLPGLFYSVLAEVKSQEGKLKDAQKIFQRAIKYQIGNKELPKRLAPTYYGYACLLSDMGKLESALVYYNKSEVIYKNLNQEFNLANIYSGKASIMLQNGDNEDALILYLKSLNLKKETNNVMGIVNSYHQIGSVLQAQNKNIEAKSFFLKCLEEAGDMNRPDFLSSTYLSLSEVNEALGYYKDANTNYKQHIIIRDSILSQEARFNMVEIEEKYDNEKLQNNVKQQKTLIFGIGIALFLVVTIAMLLVNFYRQKKRNAVLLNRQSEELHQQKIESLAQETELKSLNALMDGQEIEKKRIAQNLHDSLGSLLSTVLMHFNSLSKQVTFESPEKKSLWDKTFELIQETASYNKVLAYQMMPPVLIKFGLPAAISYLCDRVKGTELKVKSHCFGFSSRLPEKMELIIFRAINELLNNVIKHAKATEMEIQLTLHDNELNVIIEDNGIGFDFNPLNPSYGMGLNNIQSRIKHFKGTFNIDSSPGKGSTVIINIPVELNKG